MLAPGVSSEKTLLTAMLSSWKRSGWRVLLLIGRSLTYADPLSCRRVLNGPTASKRSTATGNVAQLRTSESYLVTSLFGAFGSAARRRGWRNLSWYSVVMEAPVRVLCKNTSSSRRLTPH